MVRESDYYIWLRSLVRDCNHVGYEKLIKQLDSIEFTWVFALDENRAAGGLNLREEFAFENSIDSDNVRSGPCSVLEMLIGVAKHMEDQIPESLDSCFWILIRNLGLNLYSDDYYNPSEVEYIIDKWLARQYKENGLGSIFPLKYYPGDCRYIDIWSQMNAWINENYPENNTWLNQ